MPIVIMYWVFYNGESICLYTMVVKILNLLTNHKCNQIYKQKSKNLLQFKHIWQEIIPQPKSYPSNKSCNHK